MIFQGASHKFSMAVFSILLNFIMSNPSYVKWRIHTMKYWAWVQVFFFFYQDNIVFSSDLHVYMAMDQHTVTGMWQAEICHGFTVYLLYIQSLCISFSFVVKICLLMFLVKTHLCLVSQIEGVSGEIHCLTLSEIIRWLSNDGLFLYIEKFCSPIQA